MTLTGLLDFCSFDGKIIQACLSKLQPFVAEKGTFPG